MPGSIERFTSVSLFVVIHLRSFASVSRLFVRAFSGRLVHVAASIERLVRERLEPFRRRAFSGRLDVAASIERLVHVPIL